MREALRVIPDRGVGYGIVRYLSTNTALRERLSTSIEPEIVFNYLGQFDQMQVNDGLFTVSKSSFGSSVSPNQPSAHLLEVTCLIQGGKLTVNWAFSRNAHLIKTIDTLARGMMDTLRSLVPAQAPIETNGYVDDEFPEMALSEDSMDSILAELDL